MLRTAWRQAVRATMDRKGVTAAEYAVLAVGVVLVVATAAATLGGQLTGVFTRIGTAFGS